MKVKKLYEFLNEALEQGKINDDTEVIIEGEYGYGDSLGAPYVTIKSYIDGEKIVRDGATVVALSCDHYLYECEDIGYSSMWLDKSEADELKEEWENDD